MIALAFILVLVVVGLILVATGNGDMVATEQFAILGLLFAVFFVAGFYVAAIVGSLMLVADFAFADGSVNSFIGQVAWNANSNYVLTAVPLFLVMGELLTRSGLAMRLYQSLGMWLNRMPGGMFTINIASGAMFSTVSGSSVATTATLGSVALPYFKDHHIRDQRIAFGTVVAGGALGQLIPPGIAFIVYSLFTSTSIAALYLGGLVAGAITTALCMIYVMIRHARNTAVSPADAGIIYTWPERFLALRDFIPVVILVALVLGTIYTGFATATEAAAFGVVGALGLTVASRTFSWGMLNDSLIGAARTSAMIGLITVFAFALNYVLAFIGVPQAIAGTVTAMPLPSWAVITFIIFFYFALGTFMDGLAMMITTISVVLPIVVSLGYDPVWFGVVMVLLIEVAMISPPDGMVLYVVQGLRDPAGSIMDVFRGALPFVGIYLLVVFIITIEPTIVLVNQW